MNRRERILAVLTVGLVSIVLVDQVVLSPYFAKIEAYEAELAILEDERAEGDSLIRRKRKIMTPWKAYQASGVLDGSDLLYQRMNQNLIQMSQESGFMLETIGHPQTSERSHEDPYWIMKITVSGHGTLAEVQQFLAGVERVELPLQIERCALQARDASEDLHDLSLVLSMRAVKEECRSARQVPSQTETWKSPWGESMDWVSAKPFMLDRTPAKKVEAPPVVEAKDLPKDEPPEIDNSPEWVLVGVLCREDKSIAVLRNVKGNEELILQQGDKLEEMEVVSILLDHIILQITPDERRQVSMGHNIEGKPSSQVIEALASTPEKAGDAGVEKTSSSNQRSSNARGEAPPSVFGAVEVKSDPKREEILKKMRDKRNRR